MTAPLHLPSQAIDWRQLAGDLVIAIGRLEASVGDTDTVPARQAILIAVAGDLLSLDLRWCEPDGGSASSCGLAILLSVPPLAAQTDMARDDDATPPNASIDRAVSKAAAEMLSWTKDPDTFELLEHRRYWVFLCWPGEAPAPVNEYAYGLWDD